MTALSEPSGATLANSVTCRRRFKRLISDGPVERRSSTTSSSGTVPSRADGTVSKRQPFDVGAIRLVGADVHLVLLALLFVGGHLDAAHEKPQRAGDVGHLDAEVGGLVAVDVDGDFGLAADERAVHVDRAGDLGKPRLRLFGVLGEPVEIGAAHDVHDGRLRADRPRRARPRKP